MPSTDWWVKPFRPAPTAFKGESELSLAVFSGQALRWRTGGAFLQRFCVFQ